MSKVEDAIAGAEPLRMTQLQINVASTGRPVMLAVPENFTDSELFELIGWFASPDGFRATARPQKSPIALARSLPGLS